MAGAASARAGGARVVKGRVTLADGTHLAYEVRNPDAPRRILLLHALAMSGWFWSRLAEHLPADTAILTYDARGHGRSDKPAGPYTVELFADDMAALLDHAGWDRAVVGGASMGGSVSLAFAARHASRLAGLGLIDTTAWYGEDAPSVWSGRAQKAAEGGMAALVGFQRDRWFSETFRERNGDIVEEAVEVFLANDVKCYGETCRMLGNFDMRGTLPGIACPVSIIVGAEDYATPVAMAQAMHEEIPGSTLGIIPGVRHFTPIEAPETVASELTALLERAGK